MGASDAWCLTQRRHGSINEMNAYSLVVVRRRFRGATGAGYACW
jgi:hypothetical protein